MSKLISRHSIKKKMIFPDYTVELFAHYFLIFIILILNKVRMRSILNHLQTVAISLVSGQLLRQLWTSGLVGTRSSYCVETTVRVDRLHHLHCWCWYCGSSHLNSENSTQQEDMRLWHGPRHLTLFILMWTRVSLWSNTFVAEEEHLVSDA